MYFKKAAFNETIAHKAHLKQPLFQSVAYQQICVSFRLPATRQTGKFVPPIERTVWQLTLTGHRFSQSKRRCPLAVKMKHGLKLWGNLRWEQWQRPRWLLLNATVFLCIATAEQDSSWTFLWCPGDESCFLRAATKRGNISALFTHRLSLFVFFGLRCRQRNPRSRFEIVADDATVTNTLISGHW